ncbi:Ferroxidase [Aphelenchoides bicaudatus]|nr:Ferroxidase [Aphelenchoides bicaudatus]
MNLHLFRPITSGLLRAGFQRTHQFRQCTSTTLSELEFDKQAESTLHALTDFFDTLPERLPTHSDFDVSYSMGVLTLHVAPKIGTYVINKQTPNRQIWLSSPMSGPKRYDWIDKQWIYKHDDVSLHQLLEAEFAKIFNAPSIGILELK